MCVLRKLVNIIEDKFPIIVQIIIRFVKHLSWDQIEDYKNVYYVCKH